MSDSPGRAEDVVRRYLACYNEGDIEGMLACVARDVVFENISNSGRSMKLEGRAAMEEVAKASSEAFTQRRQTLISIVDSGARAAAEIAFEGVPAVDLPNGARAGEPVRLHGASFFELRDGLLSRIADYS